MRALALCLLIAAGFGAQAEAASTLKVERVFVLMRHGVRAPIDGEVPAGTQTARPLPQWPVAAEEITPHGAKAVANQAKLDRALLARQGLLLEGCPAAGAVRIWSNSVDRTIATGQAYAAGFASGCDIPAGHQEMGSADPFFEALRADASFDPAKAIVSITAYTGGLDALAKRHQPEIRLLDKLLDCGRSEGCSPLPPSSVHPSADGKGIDLTGPIRTTSGTAQVLLLLYAEGLAGPGTAWPAITPASLKTIGALHAALFDVFTRPPYMAAHQAGPVAAALEKYMNSNDPADPVFDLLVGHDTNVTALAALLDLKLTAPGYATGDVAPGGALWIERMTNHQGQHFLRFFNRTQSPQQLRQLSPHASMTRLILPGCANGPGQSCPLESFNRIVATKLDAGK